jgi:hypothetical protein
METPSEYSLIRTGTLDEFHTWFNSLETNVYNFYIAKDPTDVSSYDSICLYIPPDVASFRPWVKTITSTLGQYPRIAWVCFPGLLNHWDGYSDGCGCIPEWGICCQTHGGPLSEIERASATYLENVGHNRKSNLIMLHRIAGKHASSYKVGNRSNLYSELCLHTFDMIMYTEPTTEEWIREVCRMVVGKRLEKQENTFFT